VDNSVFVIGGGLGGLSATIHLQLAGFAVTLYEANERVGGRANLIEREGFRFDTGPSLLNYPWVFEQLFEAAGRKLSDYVTLLPVDPSVSFQWRDGTRFTLSSNLQRLLEECERVAPGSRTSVLAFLSDAEAKYQMAFGRLINRNVDHPIEWLKALSLSELRRLSLWRSLDGELRRFFSSPYLLEALGSYGMYLGGSPYRLPGLFSILPYGELAYGLWMPKGGIYSLVTGIEKLACELGAVIHTGQRVRRVLIENRRITGVELSNGHTHKAPIVVSNVDLPTTNTDLIAKEVFSKQQHRQTRRLPMTPGVLTFYWGIRGAIENLGHHTIFLPKDSQATYSDLFKRNQIPGDLPFYVSVPSATDSDLAPPGDTTLFILTPTPVLSKLKDVDWQATTQAVRMQILERLRQHGIVILPERIVVEEVYTPHDWRERFGLYDGSAFGVAHTLFQVGPFRPRNYAREVDGLYYTGASTTPGTGLPMVVLSGKLTAERIRQRVSDPGTEVPAPMHNAPLESPTSPFPST